MKIFAKYGYYLSSIVTMLTRIHHPWFIIRLFLRKPDNRVKLIHLRTPPVVMNIRSRMDCWSVKEAMLDGFYSRFGFDIADNWMIMDIGAAIGEFTVDAALKAKNGRVFAYEPFEESFFLLQQNLAHNGIENVISRQVAIWSSNGKLPLSSVTGEPLQIETGSTHQDNAHSHSTINSIDLKTAFEQADINHLDLLKLDCEGAEYPILFAADKRTLDKVERIVLEYHDGIGQYQHQQLADFLREMGYTVIIEPNVVHDHIGYMYAMRMRME